MATRIGILGGTFDPIHYGHLLPAQYAMGHLGLARLLLVPAAAPVHRPQHRPAPPEDRLRMCELAAAPLPRFEACDREIRRTEPSYTVATLRQLRQDLGPGPQLVLLVGTDNLPLLHTWKALGTITRLAMIVPMPRPGGPAGDLAALRALLGDAAVDALLARTVPAPRLAVSATEIRRRVRAGESIDGLTPCPVASYIRSRGLYGGCKPNAG